jgi:Protein of unknown function (DUF3037)
MPDAQRSPFAYAVLRVIPHVERGEQINVGVILFCRPRRFLGLQFSLDDQRLAALARDIDALAGRGRLETLARIADGDPSAGPIARLPRPERFHWLVSPASTIVQPSEVHTGLTDDPRRSLDHLMRMLVETPGAEPAVRTAPEEISRSAG